MSVSFIDDISDYRGNDSYLVDESPIGKVFISREDIVINGQPRIRYEKHPWIEQFEFDGMLATEARREGYGTKDLRGFVQSLYTIYAKAYDDYDLYGCDASGYFAHVAEHFVGRANEAGGTKMYRKFCGFTENLWRVGNKEMHDVALETVLPIIEKDAEARSVFYDHITSEFKNYIEENAYGKKEE